MLEASSSTSPTSNSSSKQRYQALPDDDDDEEHELDLSMAVSSDHLLASTGQGASSNRLKRNNANGDSRSSSPLYNRGSAMTSLGMHGKSAAALNIDGEGGSPPSALLIKSQLSLDDQSSATSSSLSGISSLRLQASSGSNRTTHSRSNSRAASPIGTSSVKMIHADGEDSVADHEVIPVINSSLDDDWNSDDEDEAGLRRYHFVPSQSQHDVTSSHFPSLPAEFDRLPWWERCRRRAQEWQRTARQRRAARLLSTLRSDSPWHRMHLCALTWCWDSTDRSIALLIGATLAWIFLGLVGRLGATWWWTGLWVLAVRLGARPLYDAVCLGKPRARWRNASSSALTPPPPVEAMELGLRTTNSGPSQVGMNVV